MVGPGHGEGDELLELPTAASALRVGRGFPGRRGDQVSGIAEQELPAVAPVFVRLALAAQRLRPGGYSRVLAQVLGHVLRHVGPAGRGECERTEPSGGARPCQRGLHRRASRDRPSSSPNPKTTEHGADEPPTSAGRRPAPFYHLAAAARSRVLPAPARSPGVLCGDAEPPATRRQGEPGRGGAEATEGRRPPATLRGRAAPGAAGARRSGGAL